MKINESNAHYWDTKCGSEHEIWKLNGEERFFEVPVELVRDFDNAIETRDNKADELYWLVIESLGWNKDHDIKRIKTKLQKLDKKTKGSVEEFARYLQSRLKTMFHDEWVGKQGIGVSDDGWDDLTAEVVGCGSEFYEQITAPRLRQMAENNNYHENFLYVFQD